MNAYGSVRHNLILVRSELVSCPDKHSRADFQLLRKDHSQGSNQAVDGFFFFKASFRPINAVFVPIRIQKTGTVSVGTIIIYASGEMGLTDVVQTAGFWGANNTGCGLAGDTTISFCTNG